MSWKPKKLELSSETIHKLDNSEMESVKGEGTVIWIVESIASCTTGSICDIFAPPPGPRCW